MKRFSVGFLASIFIPWITSMAMAGDPPSAVDTKAKAPTLLIGGGGSIASEALTEFVRRAGAGDGFLVVIPDPAKAAHADALAERFRSLGLRSVLVLNAESRAVADSVEFVRLMEKATAIWFGGGVQSHITDLYVGTRTERAIMALYRRGAVIGGSSAGAAVQCRTMICGGKETARLGTGFDLLPGAIIDQHFSERGREKRLRDALRRNPRYLGIGVDEAAAVIVQGDRFSVYGGNVHVFPAGGRLPPIMLKAGETVGISGLRRGRRQAPAAANGGAKP